MRITKFYAKGFIGIKDGTGKDEIYIDFTKFNKLNNIILIYADGNGKGKTALMSIMHPLRESFDGREPVLKGKKAIKEISLIDDKTNDIYVIKHTWNPNKAFIEKNNIELNENGNIRSFNKLALEHLGIDGEYFKVGRLGSNVTNFMELTSGNRKTYMGNYLPYIDDYLNMYKLAQKAHTTLNKNLNSISLDLNKFPEMNILESKKSSLSSKINKIKKSISTKEKRIAVLENELLMIIKEYVDEDDIEDIKEVFDDLLITNKKNIKDVEYNINKFKDIIHHYRFSEFNNSDIDDIKKLSNLKSLKEYENVLDEYTKLYNDITNKLSELMTIKKSLLSEIDRYNKDIESNKNLIDFDYKEEIEDYKEEIEELKKYISDIENKYDNFDKYDILSKYTLDEFKNMRNKLLNVYDDISELLTHSINVNYETLESSISKLMKLNDEKDTLLTSLNKVNNDIQYYENNEVLLNGLNDRPNECNIDTCKFISESLKFKKQYDFNYSKLLKDRDNLERELNKINIKIDEYTAIVEFRKDYLKVYKKFKSLDSNVVDFLNKHKNLYTSNLDKSFYNFIMKNNIDTIQEIFSIDLLNNLFTDYNNYNSYKDQLKQLENKLIILNENYKLYKNIKDSYNESIKKKKNTITKYNNNIKLIKETNTLKLEYSNAIYGIKEVIDAFNNINKLNQEIKEYKEVIDSLNDGINKSKMISDYNMELNDMYNTLKSYEDEYEKIIKDLNYVEILRDKYDKVKDEYDINKIIKDSLDPKSGIPLIFIEKFLGKIKDKTNKLLDLAYDSKFRINFNITDKDFFIEVLKPFSKLPDILWASQGETALTNLSLSLAMMESMFNKYNILYLDEIDGPLSITNRKLFLKMLLDQIETLGLEQVFVITHNKEFYPYPIDLIVLENGDCKEIDLNDETFMSNKNLLYKLDS